MSRSAYSATIPFRLAENEANAPLVVAMAEHVIHSGEMEIHLAGVLRFGQPHLQVDDYEASPYNFDFLTLTAGAKFP